MPCQICAFAKEYFYETEHWRVALAPEQSYLGRCYVSLKRHCGDLAELTNTEIVDFRDVVNVLETAIRQSLHAEMFNWSCLMNNAYQEENPEPRVHWHVRPRYRNPQIIESKRIGEIIFEDPEFGHHYNRDRKRRVDSTVREEITRRIKQNLPSQAI